MICPKCAAGADLTADPAPQLEATLNLAIGLHSECRGGTWCCCRHKVPTVAVLAERRERRTGGGLSRLVDRLSVS
jgi:hypothetical protein